MREWQVGDPVGDGNDIGVPDIKYMGYLNEDDEEYNDETLENFRFHFNQSNGGFKAMNYEIAFDFLWGAFEIYRDLNNIQKKQLSENPFAYRFVVELCSNIYNRRDENQMKAFEILKKQKIPFIICDDCGNLYPDYYKRCYNCGKSFENLSQDDFERKLTNDLESVVYDKPAVGELVQRTKILMNSNGCRLAKIEEIDFMNINFVFEKEHEYFTTTYTCLFSQEYHDIRIFEDFEETHDHTRLLQNETFQRAVKETERKTGFRFIEVRGGYGSRLDRNRMDFVFTDEIYIVARFDMKNGHAAVYDIDLDKIKLSEDYRKY